MCQNAVNMKPVHKLEMSDETFDRFSMFIREHCSVKMPPAKKVMLSVRLSKRLRQLGLYSFEDYYDYVASKQGLRDELEEMTQFLRRLSAPLLPISNQGDVVDQVRRHLGVPGRL